MILQKHGWADRWSDEWQIYEPKMNREVEGQMSGGKDRWMDGQMDRLTENRPMTDRWMNRRLDRQMD